MSPTLVGLAPELVENILSFLDPHDLVHFGRTCWLANAFIQSDNQILWRAAFLKVFDDPIGAWSLLPPTARSANLKREAEWDWHREVERRLSALRAATLDSPTSFLDPESVITTFLDIFDTASYQSSLTGDAISKNLTFLEGIFDGASKSERLVHDYHYSKEDFSASIAISRGRNRRITRSMSPRRIVPTWASRFHVFYGITQREYDSEASKGAARAIVYDWSTTGPSADYGPFYKDNSGNINWAVLEAAMSLMVRIFDGTISYGYRTPCTFEDNLSGRIVPKSPAMSKTDWAGITGSWLGTYAFLDYRALVHYNFANTHHHPVNLGAYEEASGDLMKLQLKLDESEVLRKDRRLKTSLPICEDLPTLYFSGSSESRPRIFIRGAVSLVPGGREVRWRYIINYSGADQWQLEGVQPGGVRSGGVYGLWSHCDHFEEDSPIGPFVYYPYKLADHFTHLLDDRRSVP